MKLLNVATMFAFKTCVGCIFYWNYLNFNCQIKWVMFIWVV